MAESTLSLDRTELRARIGLWLGYGLGDVPDPLHPNQNPPVFKRGEYADPQKHFIVSDCVRGGLQQVVKPPKLPGEAESHDWTWLSPVASMTLASGASSIGLPDDFGGIQGRVYLSDAGSDAFCPVPVVNEERIFALQSEEPGAIRPPELVAISWIKGTTPTTGQRAQMLVWPQADQAYTLQFKYYFLPNALNGTAPFPPGGAFLAETINASVKAYAEVHYESIIGGPMYQQFMSELAASVSADRRNIGQSGGYDWDRSDRMNRFAWFDPLHTENSVITYVGSN